MTATCGWCAGIERLTPVPIANRPGLSALAYRAGTHATFLETMRARLAAMWVDIDTGTTDGARQRIYPLAALTTRAADDPAIAFLDAWATVADVLTFYQERIANEGYLRTATERRSILELARLVGYRLRPGVAASVYLAYTLEPEARVEIPAGSRVQSLPGPGELPQPFETSETLEARAEWNNLQVRRTRPQQVSSPQALQDPKGENPLYLLGTATNLKPNDAIWLDFGEKDKVEKLLFVRSVEPQPEQGRTKVVFGAGAEATAAHVTVGQLLPALLKPAARALPNALRLRRDLGATFALRPEKGALPVVSVVAATTDAPGPKAISELASRLYVNFKPALAETLYSAWAKAPATSAAPLQRVYAFRTKAALFGHNASQQPELVKQEEDGEKLYRLTPATLSNAWGRRAGDGSNGLKTILLDADYEGIARDSWLAVVGPIDGSTAIRRVEDVASISMPFAGAPTRVTAVTLDRVWLTPEQIKEHENNPALLRDTTVYARSEALWPAEEPIAKPVCDHQVELAGLFAGLDSGRWVVVCGERADVKEQREDEQGEQANVNASGELPPIPGVHACELVMLSGVRQQAGGLDGKLLGDTTHTVIELSPPLSYCYKRDTVTIYGNVVKATHGETREEVLGSGDGSKALQQFPLRQAPLTYLAAPTPAGAASTLSLRVNSLEWHEADSLALLNRTDRRYVTHTDDQGTTTVQFGNGERGARLPTGVENVKAVYRTGIGKPGNVGAGQISLPSTRPLGVKGVTNPLRASGGADPDSREQARRSTPLAVMALDRLVSVQDYADFARTFAGIGKASAVPLSDGRRQLVHVTIAGADDVPIDERSDLYRNLSRALHEHGDPYQPIQLAIRELTLLVVSARVRVRADHQWESVAPALRAALLDAFSFERRELGQDVVLSEVISAMQMVDGVDYVDVDTLQALGEDQLRQMLGEESLTLGLPENGRVVIEPARQDPRAPHRILPAQIAYLTPAVPDTLILNLVE
jgi:hypothetical protein